MNPARLPGRQISGGGAGGTAAPAPAPVVPAPVVPAATPSPAAPGPSGESFTGLDPLTRSLIEAAPLVPAQAPAPVSTPSIPPTQGAPAVVRRTLRSPAVLVALGGSLAAGLLILSGATSRSGRTGHPAAGRGSAAAPTSVPILPVNLPAPAPTWLIAGGRA